MKSFFYSIMMVTLLVACDNGSSSEDANAETDSDSTASSEVMTPSGVRVEILKAGNGTQPQVGDIVEVDYTGKLASNGEVFDSSVNSGRPFKFAIGKGQVIKGWDEGIAQLSVGAKANLHIPAALGYGAQATGSIPPNSDLMFEVEVISIQPAPQPISHDVYETEGLEESITNSGITYYIIEEGEGQQIAAGSKVKVHYYGYFLEGGEKFDNSFERGQPIEITVGQRQVIPGWEESLALLKGGDKAKVIIPPALAYGERGYPGVIPPNATLVFDMQVMSVE